MLDIVAHLFSPADVGCSDHYTSEFKFPCSHWMDVCRSDHYLPELL